VSGQRQWNSTLKRGKGLGKGKGPKSKKVTGVHTGPPKKPKLRPSTLEADNRRLFQDAAWNQKVCAVTGKAGPWHPHHVVYEQHLRDRNLPIYDGRNALRVNPQAHWAHHKSRPKIKTSQLLDVNIDYAFDVLGPYAADYLRRYYDDSDPDPRIIAHERSAAA
jgi:hypothetical protein